MEGPEISGKCKEKERSETINTTWWNLGFNSLFQAKRMPVMIKGTTQDEAVADMCM